MNKLSLILFALLTIVTTACDGESVLNDSATLYDIATFDDNTDAGAQFSLQRQNDSPTITLLARGVTLDTANIKPGTRAFIGYIPASGKSDTSGDISLTAASAINNDVLRISSLDSIPAWDGDPIYLNSIWRTGKYLNIYCRVSQSDTKRTFILLVDRATRGDSIPQLYLAHNLLGKPQSYTRRAYLSVDISSLWGEKTCKGVTVHINDSNLPQETYTFLKSN